jgi:hypothetical protein
MHPYLDYQFSKLKVFFLSRTYCQLRWHFWPAPSCVHENGKKLIFPFFRNCCRCRQHFVNLLSTTMTFLAAPSCVHENRKKDLFFPILTIAVDADNIFSQHKVQLMITKMDKIDIFSSFLALTVDSKKIVSGVAPCSTCDHKNKKKWIFFLKL